MRAEEPQISPTGRYSTAQAARALGIHRCTLARYADAGIIKFGFRAVSHRRFYLGSELLKLWRNEL